MGPMLLVKDCTVQLVKTDTYHFDRSTPQNIKVRRDGDCLPKMFVATTEVVHGRLYQYGSRRQVIGFTAAVRDSLGLAGEYLEGAADEMARLNSENEHLAWQLGKEETLHSRWLNMKWWQRVLFAFFGGWYLRRLEF